MNIIVFIFMINMHKRETWHDVVYFGESSEVFVLYNERRRLSERDNGKRYV